MVVATGGAASATKTAAVLTAEHHAAPAAHAAYPPLMGRPGIKAAAEKGEITEDRADL